jgi:hypothetical protein
MRALFCLLLATASLHGLPSIEVAVQEQNAASSALSQKERQHLLNSALATYLEYAKDSPSGMLLNNIGSVYFSLGEFGTAIAYYRQALALLPRDVSIQQNLQIAATQAGVEHLQQDRAMTDLFGLRWCSPAERSIFIMGAIAFSFVFLSLHLWFPFVGFLWIGRIAATGTALLLSSLIWYTLFVPQQAIIVHATPLRTSLEAAPGEPSLPAIRAGEVVEVLESDALSDTTRVQTASEAIGYIPRGDICFSLQ